MDGTFCEDPQGIFQIAYFDEYGKANPGLVNFYRSFYTEKHIQYMQTDLKGSTPNSIPR